MSSAPLSSSAVPAIITALQPAPIVTAYVPSALSSLSSPSSSSKKTKAGEEKTPSKRSKVGLFVWLLVI